MRLEQILFSQGFGTRYECRALICSGQVKVAQVVKTDPDENIETQELEFEVKGQLWPYKEKVIIALNKPSGYECSQKPIHHPSVMTLIPSVLRRRGVQPVGRLDEDTTGLLILTDDGALQHRLIHPKKHVAKTYRVTCKHPCSDLFYQRLLQGVLIEGEKLPVKAFELKPVDSYVFEMVIFQGKYHQVKRMVAAAGNRVQALQRVAFGKLRLPEALQVGQWRFIEQADLFG